jgi:hypothetical protein
LCWEFAPYGSNRNLWIAQYHQELHERDLISGLSAAQRKGHRDGVRERSLALVKKFMSMGHTAEEAAEKNYPAY